MQQRLHKHYTNAMYGIDTQFYRAIRKHGIDSFTSKVLAENIATMEEAQKLEMFFIEEFNTYKMGYNATKGGTGGDCISGLSEEKYKEWQTKMKKIVTGKNNGRYSGYTDKDILNDAKQFIIEHGYFMKKEWDKRRKEKKIPLYFSKFRFGGKGYKGFLEELREIMITEGYDLEEIKLKNRHAKSQSHIDIIKKNYSEKDFHWYNDGTKSYLLPQESSKIKTLNLIRGRLCSK